MVFGWQATSTRLAQRSTAAATSRGRSSPWENGRILIRWRIGCVSLSTQTLTGFRWGSVVSWISGADQVELPRSVQRSV